METFRSVIAAVRRCKFLTSLYCTEAYIYPSRTSAIPALYDANGPLPVSCAQKQSQLAVDPTFIMESPQCVSAFAFFRGYSLIKITNLPTG